MNLRNALEFFSARITIISGISILHNNLWYLTFSLAVILFFYLLIREEIEKIAKVVYSGFIIIILPPIIDLIVSGEKIYKITYMLPQYHPDLLRRFFTFFGEFSGVGVTPGVRTEIFLVLIGTYLYLRAKKSSVIRSLGGTFGLYGLIFCFFSIPFILKFLLGDFYVCTHLQMVDFHVLLSLILGFILYVLSKEKIKYLIRDIRIWRLAHFESMFGLGILLGIKEGFFQLYSHDVLNFILVPIGIASAWIWCVMVNNMSDYEIDQVSNPDRPLVARVFSRGEYKNTSWIFLVVTLIIGSVVDFKTFFLLLLFMGNYFLYSAPPFRLKRIPVFSKLLVGINSLALIFLGFNLIGGNIRRFPSLIIALVLVGITLASNFIDIKDYEGDKKENIKTLPVILGPKKAKIVIGLFFMVAYLVICFVSTALIVPALIIGIIQFLLINRKNYKEWPVFALYLISLLGIYAWIVFGL